MVTDLYGRAEAPYKGAESFDATDVPFNSYLKYSSIGLAEIEVII